MTDTIETITKLPATEMTQVNIKKKFFDIIEARREDATYTYEGSLYVGELGTGNKPIMIKSNERDLPLGENRLYLKKSESCCIWSPEMVGAFPFNKADIDKMLSVDFRNHDNPYMRVGERLEAMYDFYETVTPVGVEVLKQLSPADFNFIIERFVDGKYRIDPQTRDWGKMNLKKFTPNPKNVKLVKYNPHAVIIKPEKAGFSSIAARIGENVDQVTIKSLEGIADAQGNITHSPLHNNWGSINVDEVSDVERGTLQRVFDYLERGELLTIKAGRRIHNKGAATLNFTSNPEAMKQREGEDVQPLDYVNAFLNLLYNLTTRPGPASSRLGRIIFEDELKRAEQEYRYSDDLQEKINAVARSIIEITAPAITKIYQESEEWLNQPIEAYSEELDGVIKAAGFSLNSAVKDFIKGQRHAYRHIRGGALALACVEHLREIFLNDYDISEIYETAEEKLQVNCALNIESFKKILAFSKVVEQPENFIKKFGDARPEYVKPILMAYIILGRARKDGEKLSGEELRIAFETLPSEVRVKILGDRYAYWSRVSDATDTLAHLDKITVCLNSLFSCRFRYELTTGKPNWWIENEQQQAERYWVYLKGVFPPLGGASI
jgi:hypothetical protein